MRKYNLIFAYAIFIVGLTLLLSSTANAQYWFQSGVRGSGDGSFNNGAGVSIQTVYQNATNGSLGFWVGETLSNGAFIQAGYEIANATGYYSSSCKNSTANVFLKAGVPSWFWEYFAANSNSNVFCGGIGANGSAGANGSFSTYSFKSDGTVWSAYLNNQLLGSIDLGTTTSGANPPSAFAEYADTKNNKAPINTVQFKNLDYYLGNVSRLVDSGISVVSYGKGSLTGQANPYGVEELGNYADYFEVGSGLPLTQFTQLWKIGYNLSVSSSYGNITGTSNYKAYSSIPISAPSIVNISNGERELFEGWIGTGTGSYTGNDTDVYLTLYQNITEVAVWQREYYLNASTEYGTLSGSGWYNANSTASVYISSNIITVGPGSRALFSGWSNGDKTNQTKIYLDSPKLLLALWSNQYYLNATTEYGTLSGSGWYTSNSIAKVSLNTTVVPINQSSRLAFSGWSNGNLTNNISIVVSKPTTIHTIFSKQYLVKLAPENSYGQNITGVVYYNISSNRVNSDSIFLFENKSYVIEYLYYKGVILTINQQFKVNSPVTLSFKTPVYNIAINTQSVFETPVNASLNITFKNNSNLELYSGNTGNQSFNNVPYGYVTGYAEYFGFKQSINLGGGSSSYLTFFTASLVWFIIGGILFVVLVATLASRHQKRHGTK